MSCFAPTVGISIGASAAAKLRGVAHAARLIADHEVLQKLFSVLADRYKTRPGGYTRIIRNKVRLGDAGEMRFRVRQMLDRVPHHDRRVLAGCDRRGHHRDHVARVVLEPEHVEEDQQRDRGADDDASRDRERVNLSNAEVADILESANAWVASELFDAGEFIKARPYYRRSWKKTVKDPRTFFKAVITHFPSALADSSIKFIRAKK